MTRGARAVGLAIVIGLVAFATPALAWPLYYPPTETACVDAAGFRRQVEDQRAAPDTDVDVAIRLETTRAGDTWTVDLTIFVGAEPGARRELQAPSCAEAVAAASLIAALALDAAPPLPALLPAVPTVTPPAAPPRTPPRPRRPPPGPRAATPPLTAAVTIELGAAPFGLPGVALGARADLGLGVGPLGLGLGGGGFAGSTQTDATGVGAEASLWFAAVALRAGPWHRLTLGTMFEIGKLAAQGVGVALPRRESLQWQAVGAGLRFEMPTWRGLRPAVAADVAFPLTSRALQVNGTTRFETGPMLRLWIGAALPIL